MASIERNETQSIEGEAKTTRLCSAKMHNALLACAGCGK